MKCIFIYNPNSGKGKILKYINYIKEQLLTKYDVVDLYPTKSQQDTIDAAKKSSNNYDAIIFSGGDGTFNDVTCGVSEMDKRPLLGYIPCGTVNDIARNLKISKNIKKAVRIILEGNYVNHDVGLINNKYFVYVAGVGTFTSISYRTKQKYKKILGKTAYILDGIKDIVNPSIVNVKITTKEGQIFEGKSALLLVTNSISVGGIPFNKNGHLNDGYFDIIVVKKYIGKGLIAIANTMLIGIRKKRITRYYEIIRSSDFKIEVEDNIVWTLDGEKGMNGSVNIKNLHNHIQIFVKHKYEKPTSRYL